MQEDLFDLLSVALALTAANLSVLTKRTRLDANDAVMFFFSLQYSVYVITQHPGSMNVPRIEKTSVGNAGSSL